MAKFVHTMIRVLDEGRSVDFYKRAFGLDVAHRLEFETFTLTYLSSSESDFELELTVNKGVNVSYEPGNGYGHLAFVVEDLDDEHERFVKEGFNPRKIVDFQHNGEILARFFFVEDPDGYKLEVIQKGGRYSE